MSHLSNDGLRILSCFKKKIRYKFCCAKYCLNDAKAIDTRTNKHVKLHGFPNPKHEPERLPKEEPLRQKWVAALRREDFVSSKRTHLCNENFEESVIDRTALACVRLREGAVPTIFRAFPSYLQCTVRKRKPPTNGTHSQNEPEPPAGPTTAGPTTDVPPPEPYSISVLEPSPDKATLKRKLLDTEGKLNSKLEADQDNTLIAAIEPHRCLYDPGHEGYHDPELKKTVWKNIAKNLGLPVSKVRTRWNILERSYRAGIKSTQRLPAFGKLSFLKTHLQTESEDQCPSTDRGSISIKSEVLSSDEEFADTVEASPSDIGAARSHRTEAYKSTRVSVVSLEEKDSHEDLDMKVEEEAQDDRLLAANSSSFQMLLSDQSSAGNKIQNSSERKINARRIFTKLDEGRVDPDLEYFKGFQSLIKELSTKRKRQLFASFAQMLFQHLEEQESEEADSNEMF